MLKRCHRERSRKLCIFKAESDRYRPQSSSIVLYVTACRRTKHHRSHHRVTGGGRRVVAPPCPRSTALPRRFPVGRLESFRSWSSHLFRGLPGGRRHASFSSARVHQPPIPPVQHIQTVVIADISWLLIGLIRMN